MIQSLPRPSSSPHPQWRSNGDTDSSKSRGDAKAKLTWQKICNTWRNIRAITKDHKETNMLIIPKWRKKFIYSFNNYFCFKCMTSIYSLWSVVRKVHLWSKKSTTYNCQHLVVPPLFAECKWLRALVQIFNKLIFFLETNPSHLQVSLTRQVLQAKFPESKVTIFSVVKKYRQSISLFIEFGPTNDA